MSITLAQDQQVQIELRAYTAAGGIVPIPRDAAVEFSALDPSVGLFAYQDGPVVTFKAAHPGTTTIHGIYNDGVNEWLASAEVTVTALPIDRVELVFGTPTPQSES